MENGGGLGPWVNYKGFQALHLCHQIHVSKISINNGIIGRIGICKIVTSTIPSQQISVKNRINKWANTWLDIVVCLLLTEYVFMRICVSYKCKSWSQVLYMYSLEHREFYCHIYLNYLWYFKTKSIIIIRVTQWTQLWILAGGFSSS